MVRRSGNKRRDIIHKKTHAPATTVQNVTLLCDVQHRTSVLIHGMERLQETLKILVLLVTLLAREYEPIKDWITASDEIHALPPDLPLEEQILICMQHMVPCEGIVLAAWVPTTDRLHPISASGIFLDEEYRLSTDDHLRLHTLLRDPTQLYRLQAGKIISVSLIAGLPLGQHIVLPLLYQHQLRGIALIAYSQVRYIFAPGGYGVLQTIMRLSTLLLQLKYAQWEQRGLPDEEDSTTTQWAWMRYQMLHSPTGIRHAIDTAMMEIHHYRGMFFRHLPVSDTMRGHASNSHTDVRHILQLLQSLVELALLEQEYLQPQWEWLDMNALIVDTVHQQYISVTRRRIHLQLTRALPLIVGDRMRLMQVVTILLSTALKRSGTDDVTVSSWISKNRLLHICIQIGGRERSSIVPHLLDVKPLDLDGQEQEGTGDTLLLVRAIIQLHDGQLWIDSTAGYDIAWHFTLHLSHEPLEQKIASRSIS